ncbi:MAG: ABC transporter permease [Lachnospiraceae bacterium]|nr:ABC transporter permease [Lachnospiraceae bacterium]
MIHIIKYSQKVFRRNKNQLFWVLMFPIILGVLFKTAFSGITDADTFSTIPVAVISDSKENEEVLKEICENVKINGSNLLKADFNLSEKEAMEKLEANDIYGIIYTGEKLSLKVSANTGDDNTKQSILDSFVAQYNASANIIKEVASTNPDKLMDVMAVSSSDVTYNEEHKFVSSNAENYTQYFYNLLAMACLFTALAGMSVAINNQGNLSDLGARRNITSTGKLKLIVGELFSVLTLNYLLIMIAFAFIIIVLKVDLTFHLPYAILAMFVATLTSVTYGFFIGSVPIKKRGVKEAFGIASIMFCCFLSGLMIGSMHIIMEEISPVLNKINPASLISDSLYSLANYENLGRYYEDITILLIMAVIFTLGGFLLTRRKKYASI